MQVESSATKIMFSSHVFGLLLLRKTEIFFMVSLQQYFSRNNNVFNFQSKVLQIDKCFPNTLSY